MNVSGVPLGESIESAKLKSLADAQTIKPRDLKSHNRPSNSNHLTESGQNASTGNGDPFSAGDGSGTTKEQASVTQMPHLTITNDNRQFEHELPYLYQHIESIEDDQRQKRRLQSARRQHNILDANEEHISTMINSVFSSSRDFVTNQTARSSVVRYLTNKMRLFGLVTGNQLFDPQEFYDLVLNGFILPQYLHCYHLNIYCSNIL